MNEFIATIATCGIAVGFILAVLWAAIRHGRNDAQTEQKAQNADILQKQRDVVAPGNVHDATDRLRHLKP